MILRIFLDSDVVISSLISPSGAANFLINNIKDLELSISNYSVKELEVVVNRLGLAVNQLQGIVDHKCLRVNLTASNEDIKEEYKKYVLDTNDGHIVAGAREAKVRFLISYNLKHYKIEAIKEDFGIIVLTPAQFIQYLRSV